MELATARPEVRTALGIASRYGWKVFPVTAGDKKPAIKGWQSLASADPAVWSGWWAEDGSHPATLVGVATGLASDVWVFDVDVKGGGRDSWIGLGGEHGDDWGESHLTARTPSGGRHQIYAYPTPEKLAELGVDRVKNRTAVLAGIDVRGQGGLIVAPGQDGRPIVGEQPEVIAPAPDWLIALVTQTDGDSDAGGGTAGTSRFTDLLGSPPAGQGGRNNWLAAVAGHLASRESYQDAYLAQVKLANRALNPPLDDEEVEKTADSIWKTELAKARAGARGNRLPEGLVAAAEAATPPSKGRTRPSAPSADDELAEAAAALGLDTGGLRSTRRDGKRVGRLETDVLVRVGDKQVRQPAEWADFDLVATGVTEDEAEERLYQVTLIRGRDGRELEAVLPASTLADRKKLNAWLARFGVTVADPPNPVARLGACERLIRYIEAQGPPVFELVRHIGYSDSAEAFLTLQGAITPDGLAPLGKYRPHPAVRTAAADRFHYGHDRTEDEVRAVLAEVLTFHHEGEAAVFGAWWAATLLKHVAMRHSSLFPFMAIEAPSESGKTTGMFGMLIGLSGSSGAQRTYTKASFRDDLALNRNGIVWLDDADSVEHLEEVLRAATAEGTMTKKAEDLAFNQGAHLVAPVVVSGEHLGFREEKALRDRAIHLEVSSPTTRRSQRPGREKRSQWDDILDFRGRHPDLSEYAGTLVRMAMRHEAEFARDIRSLRGSAGRRIGDAVAILRAGARLLDRLTGDGGFDDQVAHWLDENGIEDVGAENSLTLKVLPVLLDHVGHVAAPTRENRERLPHPVLVVDGQLWVNARLAAEWWSRIRRGQVVERTETAQAFTQQLKALGATTEKPFRVGMVPVREATEKLRYKLLPASVAARYLGHDGLVS